MQCLYHVLMCRMACQTGSLFTFAIAAQSCADDDDNSHTRRKRQYESTTSYLTHIIFPLPLAMFDVVRGVSGFHCCYNLCLEPIHHLLFLIFLYFSFYVFVQPPCRLLFFLHCAIHIALEKKMKSILHGEAEKGFVGIIMKLKLKLLLLLLLYRAS